MRARNLKPSFFKNEDLGSLPFEARLLFMGMWCLADREGILEYRPLKWKAEIFPYDNVDCTYLGWCLHRKGLVLVYEREGARLIFIPAFHKHQRPHVKETASNFPQFSAEYIINPGKVGASTDLGECQHALNPESPFLNPEYSLPRESGATAGCNGFEAFPPVELSRSSDELPPIVLNKEGGEQ